MTGKGRYMLDIGSPPYFTPTGHNDAPRPCQLNLLYESMLKYQWSYVYTEPKNVVFGKFYLKMFKDLCFFGSCVSNYIFFAIFLKCARLYPPFWSFCLFYEIFVAQTSMTRFFQLCKSWISPPFINHPNFFSESSCNIYIL